MLFFFSRTVRDTRGICKVSTPALISTTDISIVAAVLESGKLFLVASYGDPPKIDTILRLEKKKG